MLKNFDNNRIIKFKTINFYDIINTTCVLKCYV